MKIACFGWGSLVWNPGALPIQREWFQDGPFAPIEFSRQSSDGRMTLVIDPTASPVRLLWAHMLSPDVATAKQALKNREEITAKNWEPMIGTWQKGEPVPASIPEIAKWADARGVDAAIWTALGPRFSNQEVVPSADQVLEYLRSLTGTFRDSAKQYVERTPRQIDTEYRRRIEAALGWTFQVL
ncbi:MAG: hypothetical protein WAM13_00615 [Candidatus Sulfotelmatobacter sp.]